MIMNGLVQLDDGQTSGSSMDTDREREREAG